MDRVAVVTGGSRGVGLSVVRTLLEAGWRVHAHYRTQPADITHDRLTWWQADFTQGLPTAQASGFPQLPRIDALIHCAGVATLGSCASLERDEWERHMSVNLHSPVQLTRQLLPQLRANHARVVYINSGAGKRANPQWGAYAASKFAARAWCDALRQEEPEITVTSIFPGRIATDMQKAIVEYEGNSYNPENFIAPTTVAHCVLHSLSVGVDATIPEIVIRPRM
ncbi:SDR family oxidoreductase [Corynebacterium diphtheriae]|uniref:SDR family oxidoreductase n=1 Tax=Corynebacterium diphtheriae TaxID=1717 RepID=UPI0013C9D3D8|nr:SDR family oxidoreductase [Corynebacterium diphtheriae]CAB0669172.1 short chain dehydrogenase [Corynebacterium diphtheriae]CAB0943682.1 short chain dehydrogenase [Corynebacterium diphtheriae]CAB0943686.1 short chain dehydrogenase [Corynebacterium diphtheriae]